MAIRGVFGASHDPLVWRSTVPPSTYLGIEGQSFGVIGVHHRGVRLEDDALARRLEGSTAHGHQQIHHLGAEQGLKGQPLMALGVGVTTVPSPTSAPVATSSAAPDMTPKV